MGTRPTGTGRHSASKFNAVRYPYASNSGQLRANLQRLSAGDRVGLKRDGERFLIVNDDGHVVGRLAKRYLPPEGLRFLEGRVFAIVARKEGDSADEFRRELRRASWEVVVPELVFGPDG